MLSIVPFAAALVLLTVSPAAPATAAADAKAGDYPWLASLRSPAHSTGPGGHVCGGVLVKADKVLTAAHCVSRFRKTPGRLKATFGRTDLRRGGGATYQVKSIWIHPGHRSAKIGGRTVQRDDLAVLTLAREAGGIKPVKIHKASGAQALLLGWSSARLRKATVPLPGDAACRTAYGSPLPSGLLCAAPAGTPPCPLDEGTPLIVRVKTTIRYGGQLEPRLENRVAGLSAAAGCAGNGGPDPYTRLSAFRDILKKRL